MSKKEIIDDVNVSKFSSMKTKEQSLLLRYNVLAQGVYAGLYMSVMGVFVFLFISLLSYELFGMASGTVPAIITLFLCWKVLGFWKHYKYFKDKAQKIWDNSSEISPQVLDWAKKTNKNFMEEIVNGEKQGRSPDKDRTGNKWAD